MWEILENQHRIASQWCDSTVAARLDFPPIKDRLCWCEMTRWFKWSNKPPTSSLSLLNDKLPNIKKLAFVCKWTRTERNVCAKKTKRKKNQCKIAVLLLSQVDPCCYKPCSNLCLNCCLSSCRHLWWRSELFWQPTQNFQVKLITSRLVLVENILCSWK